MQTLRQLKKRALKRDMLIRKLVRGDEDSYCVVDMRKNVAVSYPYEMSLAGIEQWLDELERNDDTAE